MKFRLLSRQTLIKTHFVLRKKGSKTKKRMKEKEIERGVAGCQPEVFFLEFVRFERSDTRSPRRRESNVLAGSNTGPSSEDGPAVHPANTFDSRLRGDLEPLASPTKSKKKKKIIRPDQKKSLFPVARPDHFSPKSRIFFNVRLCMRIFACNCESLHVVNQT